MVKTPLWMLGEGYPLVTPEASDRTMAIWDRAFAIHAEVHKWGPSGNCIDGPWTLNLINPLHDDPSGHYCECYLKAWIEFSERHIETPESTVVLDDFPEERVI